MEDPNSRTPMLSDPLGYIVVDGRAPCGSEYNTFTVHFGVNIYE